MKRTILLILFSISFIFSQAQYFQTGQDPASLKWRQINTENFQIIYPDYYENKAQVFASMMEAVYEKVSKTLHYQPKKISIILHTQTVVSNGLVAWAPKRSEIYTIPHQGIYAQNWLEQLAIHEFRHVVQIDKINNELPKIIKLLLGQQGTALVFGAYIPWWFTEGDAVVMETALSNSGRGRFPSFLMEHKAQVVEKGIYKYDKAYNSSFKDYVPNHYQLGYYLVGKTREKYGSELWNSVLNNVGKRPFSITPFNKEIKEKTGLSKTQLYKSTLEDLASEWIAEDKLCSSQSYSAVSPKNDTWTNYTYNHYLNDSVIISYRTALNKIPAFVKINSVGKETKIHVPGRIFDESVNYNGPWIVWSEQIPDIRWQHSGKSLMRLLNVETNAKLDFFTEFTAFAPAISPNRDKLIVVESDFSSNYYLSVYNIVDGKLIHRFKTDNNNYFLSPNWLNNSEAVVVVLQPEGKRIAKISFDTNSFELITHENLGEIKNIKVIDNELLFTSSFSGKNAIYKMNLDDNSIYQIYEPRFGAESAAVSPNGKKMVLSDYSADGFRIIELENDKINPVPLNQIKMGTYSLAESMTKQEDGTIEFDSVTVKEYTSKTYSKLANLVHFHSWAPIAVDPDNYIFEPGVSFLSQNKLGTADINLGYRWKQDERTGETYIKYSFKGWYPVFDFELSRGKSASKYFLIEETKNYLGEVIRQDTSIERFTWNQTNLAVDVRLPLRLSKGKYSRFFQPEIQYDYTIYDHNSSTPEKFFHGSLQSFSYRLYYQQLLAQSNQDVFPNFGFAADLIYQHSPTGDIDFGNLALGQAYLFLPGFMPNHGIRLFAGVQYKNEGYSYSLQDKIRYPRGWQKTNTTKAFSYSIDYKLPLFYPELSLGSLVYIKRVKTSVFADFANLTGNVRHDGKFMGTFNSSISSYGVELTGDTNFLRFYAPFEVGTRISYLPELENDNFYFELLFSIDFNSL